MYAGAAWAALYVWGVSLSSEISATAMANLNLQGRRERRQLRDIEVILDVAHNPDAAVQLKEFLQAQPPAEHGQARR